MSWVQPVSKYLSGSSAGGSQLELPLDCADPIDRAQPVIGSGCASSGDQSVVTVPGSSTENSTNNAWKQRFSDGNQNNNNKNNNNLVRCARSCTRTVHINGVIEKPEHLATSRFLEPVTLEEVFQAYYSCRKNKRNTKEQLKFEINLHENLIELFEQICDRSYQPLPSRVFVVTHPKPREVWAAQFVDRVVHHIVYNRISPWYQQRFIFDSYACIPGKGIHAAVKRLQKFSRQQTQNHQIDGYYAKIDLANFFQSINLDILWSIFRRDGVVGFDSDIEFLLRKSLFEQSRSDAILLSGPELYSLVPPHKSLFAQPDNFGLPIGDLISQLCANIYNNEVDQFAKHVLKIKRYIRYVDDFILLGESYSQLREWIDHLDAFAKTRLQLTYNPSKTHLNHLSKGTDIFGYYVLPGRVYVRHDTYRRISRRCAKLARRLSAEKNPDKVLSMQQSLSSYYGQFVHTDTIMPEFMTREALCA